MTDLQKDMRKLNRAWAEATKGLVMVKTKIVTDDMAEMKTCLKEHGYNYVVGNRAWKTVNEIGKNKPALVIRHTDLGYTTCVTEVRRAN